MRAVGMQVIHLLSKPYECTSAVITTNLNFCQWAGWVTAKLPDRRLQGDEFEAVDVAVGSQAAVWVNRRGIRGGSDYASGPMQRRRGK